MKNPFNPKIRKKSFLFPKYPLSFLRLHCTTRLHGNNTTTVFFDITIGNIPAGRIKIELFADIAPITAENFRQFWTGIPNSLTSPSAPDSKNYEHKAGRTKMITRSNLAEQLREYQIRSKHDWASISFFSSTCNFTSSRMDVVVFVIWELVILAFLVFSAVSLYFRHMNILV